jgi:hypothetical protein
MSGEKNVKKLSRHLRLFLPITTEYHKEKLKEAKSKIIEITGGLTSYKGNGEWLHKGKIYSEPVEILDIWFQSSLEVLDEINNIVLNWAKQCNELALGLEYNNAFYIIELAEDKSIDIKV